MGQKEAMITREQFLNLLRSALKHFYDPYYLSQSPLIHLFDLQDQPDAIPALQRILQNAIDHFEPKAGVTSAHQNQLVYDLLTYRYIQQFSQKEVADQLGMSVRHLRREQNNAIYLLAAELWEEYHLGEKAVALVPPEAAPAEENTDQPDEEELAFLKNLKLDQPLDLRTVLSTTIELISPLADRYAVRLHIVIPERLPCVTSHLLILRQLFIHLLNVFIYRAAGSDLEIRVGTVLGKVTIQFFVQPQNNVPLPQDDSEIQNLKMALRLAEICNAQLELPAGRGHLSAALSLPTCPQIQVLVIDDNPDNIRLMQQFTFETRYQLSGVSDPREALSSALQHSPHLILLDVMMPEIDGWELLGKFRHHPQTGQIPIIVCTILSQKELALSLGASGFIHKPVTRQNLLLELDRQAELLEQGSL